MPEENPGRSAFHRRISWRAIGRPILFALLHACDSLDNGLIRIPGRRDDFPQGRVRVGTLPQDDRPEPRSQRIPIFKS